MQRPCYALAVLLGSIASSMLMVSTVNSQSPAIAAIELPGPACISGDIVEYSAICLVLGQSVDTEDDDCSVENGGTDLLASDGDQPRGFDSSLAISWTCDPSKHFWSTLWSTGYDIAYDYAMIGNRYFATASSKTEIEHPVMIDLDEAVLVADTDLTSGPTTGMSCEDYNYCVGLDCELSPPALRQDLIEADEVVPTGVESETDDCEPVVLPEGCAAWLWNGIEDTGAWAGDQFHKWWTIAGDHAWMEQFRGQLSKQNNEPNLDDLFGKDNSVEPVSASAGAGFQEEVLLISAADSLDRMGLRLQEAADQLRNWAADRIVMKSNSRRVAKKLTN